jgi:LmbE family N-acetylglucosaminyl deacetylase
MRQTLRNLIKLTDKILIIAPHPDDETLGCGGVMSKYAGQTDCMCLNSAGFQKPYEQCADTRIAEFNQVMKFYGIRRHWIWKIFGPAPNLEEIKANEAEYLQAVDFKQYDHIFIPCRQDGHVEHAFMAKTLIPKLLRRGGHKPGCMIYEYMVWGDNADKPNCEMRINPWKKKKALRLYAGRSQKALMKLAGLNKFWPQSRECFYANKIKHYLAETK